jgi:predicted GIY-YIG superfamily endonuclease
MNDPTQLPTDVKFYVYCFTNKVNGKVYIGKTKNMKKRINNHKNANGECPFFHSAIKKYGFDNFELNIIGEYLTEDEALRTEIHYIKQHQSNIRKHGYNLTSGGEGMSGYKHSPETIAKLSQSLKGRTVVNKGVPMSEEQKVKVSNSKKGKKLKLSDEQRGLMSERRKGVPSGMLGKIASDETRKKMSDAHKGNSCRAKFTMLQVNEIRHLYSTGNYTYKQLSEQFKVGISTICAIIKNKCYIDDGNKK